MGGGLGSSLACHVCSMAKKLLLEAGLGAVTKIDIDAVIVRNDG